MNSTPEGPHTSRSSPVASCGLCVVGRRTQLLVEHLYECDAALGKIQLSKRRAMLSVGPAAGSRTSASLRAFSLTLITVNIQASDPYARVACEDQPAVSGRRECHVREPNRRGAELLFQVRTEREERSAVAIASNEPFSGWTKTFTDPRLAAIVDRLTFAGQIIETGTVSYRLAHVRQQQNARKNASTRTH
jgi:IstB-like ATP binding protein